MEGFGDVVIRPVLQSFETVVLGIFGGKHEDERSGQHRVASHLLAELDAAHFGHHDVQNDEVRLLLLNFVLGFGAVFGRLQTVMPRGQNGREHFMDLRVIVDNEDFLDSCHWSFSLSDAARRGKLEGLSRNALFFP